MKKGVRISLWVVALLLALIAANALDCRVKVEHYNIKSEKISHPIRISFITDLHSSNYGVGEERIVELIKSFSPNLVMLGGDIFDYDMPVEDVSLFLDSLAKNYPTFFVVGNHEVKSELGLDTIKTIVRNSGCRLLENEIVPFEIDGDTLHICGIKDADEMRRWRAVFEVMDSLATALDSSAYNIMLFHRPEIIERYMSYPYDLVLLGHYHGGHARLPWSSEGLYAPDQSASRKYTGGLYTFGNRYAVVNRGLAKVRRSFKVPRVYIRPEIVNITIEPER